MNLRKLTSKQLYDMLGDLDDQDTPEANALSNRVQNEIDWREDGDYFVPDDTPSLQPHQFMHNHA